MIGSVGIWLTKIWWTNEFSEAKKAEIDALKAQIEIYKSSRDEIIRAKDAQIDTLKSLVQQANELTPVKLRGSYVAIKEWSEELVGDLEKKLQEARGKILRLEEEIKTENGKTQVNNIALTILEKEKGLVFEREQEIIGEIVKLEPFVKSLKAYFKGETEKIAITRFIAK